MIELKKDKNTKSLFIDSMCQGVTDSSGRSISPYMLPVKQRIAGLHTGSECLFLGLGLGMGPIYAQGLGHNVSIIESCQDIADEFKLNHGDSASIIVDEALTTVKCLELGWFDFIFLDVWPNHAKIYCADYYLECKRHLKDEGLFVVNYISSDQLDIDNMAKVLATVYPNVKMTVFYTDKEMKIPVQVVYFCN